VTAKASRLFHTVVVVGASLGCGGESVTLSRDAPDGASTTKRPDAARDVSASSRDVSTTPRDGAEGPASYCECERPGTFRCTSCRSGVGPYSGRCPNLDGVGCSCDESIRIASPSDCDEAAQFQCAMAPAIYEDAGSGPLDGQVLFPSATPYPAGWFDFVDCSCNAKAPLSARDCADGGVPFSCTKGDTCPRGSPGSLPNVAYACQCVPLPITIR
jgi:hypothetical protein